MAKFDVCYDRGISGTLDIKEKSRKYLLKEVLPKRDTEG